ncbi:hypothetical protein Tcan_06201 [Toxocara canis]|uniref:Ground-like domain-containing protein n=1 Tax=Toxocara canis TaxID=6265 RepID=A0A0B2VMZ2_TOXCA|nr:hypothetical protein Tcan_06201 [Toxocara canis]
MFLRLTFQIFLLTSPSLALFFGNCGGAFGGCAQIQQGCAEAKGEGCGTISSFEQTPPLPRIARGPLDAIATVGQGGSSSRYFAPLVAPYFGAIPQQTPFSGAQSAPHLSTQYNALNVSHSEPITSIPQQIRPAPLPQQVPSVPHFFNPVPHVLLPSSRYLPEEESATEIVPVPHSQTHSPPVSQVESHPLPSKTYEQEKSVPQVAQTDPVSTEYREGPRECTPTSGRDEKAAKAQSAKTAYADDDGKCNSKELHNIMIEKINGNPSTSKRAIQLEASTKIGGAFDVICSDGDFSYIANTRLFCEARKGNVTCFAFLHSALVA